MKAIVISSYGGPEVLTVTSLPDPVPAADEVLIAVRAFGLNHAEAYMRSGAMGEVAKVTGIECAGTVVTDPSGRLTEGTAVVAILGGMGRIRNGSYAELVTVPASNVVEVSTSLPWTDLVALPEVYATAWAGLRHNLDLRPGQTVLIRGATSALGQAAVNVAAEQGATVNRWKRSRWVPAAWATAALMGSAWDTATMVRPRCRSARRASVSVTRVCISAKDSPSGKRKPLGQRWTWVHSRLRASTVRRDPVHWPKSHSSNPRSDRTRSPSFRAMGLAVSNVRSRGEA